MRSRSIRTLVVVGLLALTLTVALVSALLVSQQPSISVATVSPLALMLGMMAGIVLGAAGSLALFVYPRERFGQLAVLTALAWFVSWWASPGVAHPALFTAGLVLAWAWPATLAHALVTLPHWPASNGTTPLVVAGYLVCIGALGIAPTLATAADVSCPACPDNLIGIDLGGGTGRAITTAGFLLAAGWAAAAALLVARSVEIGSAARRRALVPMALPAAVVLLAFGVGALSSAVRGAAAIDRVDQITWAVAAVGLVAAACGSVLRIVRGRRMRADVAGIVLELAGAGTASMLQQRFRQVVGDAQLTLAYPVDGGSLVDANGDAFEVAGSPERREIPLVRGGTPIAVLDIAADYADDADQLRGILDAAAVGLEHERLLALSRARLRELRASRARVVQATDAERRRLERGLHDGAQQRLAGLTLAIGSARAHASPVDAERLKAAQNEVRTAIAETRDIGHGIYPASLADLGLAEAVHGLAEGSTFALDVGRIPMERLPGSVESAAYFVVAEAPRLSGARSARVTADVRDGALHLELQMDGATSPLDLTELEDRIEALGGTIAASRTQAHIRLEAAIPCA
jgi:signal transduction histidine kinase